MTKSHNSNRKGSSRLRLSQRLQMFGSLFLSLVVGGEAFARAPLETRVTALLPGTAECREYSANSGWKAAVDKNGQTVFGVSDEFSEVPKKICYLQFSTESIPENATITHAVLRLVQRVRKEDQLSLDHEISVGTIRRRDWTTGDWKKNISNYEDSKKEYFLGIVVSEEQKNDRVDHWASQAANPPVFQEWKKSNGSSVALFLSPRRTGAGRNYHPFTDDTKDSASNQPRLILTYTVPRSSIPRSPDSQSDGQVAMRSPRAFIPEPNIPTQDSYKAMKVVGEDISSYTAAMYGGLTYVVRKYADTQNNLFDWHLDAQEPLGKVMWSEPLTSALSEKARVVVNDAGRLTIVSRDRFIAYQLNTAVPRQQPVDPLKDEPVSGVTAPKALLSAPDGSLYVIDDTYLYALNPDLQMLWRTGIGTSADARMTLSPDGRFVYATVNLADDKKGLLAINAQTGKSPPMLVFPPETKFFHNPVVIKHPDGADYIYIAANSQNSGVLRTVKNVAQGKIGDRIALLSQVKQEDEKGFFSQPAADSTSPKDDLSTKKLYVVWREIQKGQTRMVSINGQSGEIENPDAAPLKKDSQGHEASIEDASWLWSGGNLAMDSKGNVIFWENGTLYGYEAGNKRLFAQQVNRGLPDAEKLPTKLQMLFGSDGTLYAQDSSNGTLFALIPSYELPTTASTITSPTHLRVHLRVNGVVDKATTLSAGGSVLLGKGFKVKNGTTFTVRTNSLKK